MANCLKCKHRDAFLQACLDCPIGGESCGLSHGGASWVSLDSTENPDRILAGRIARDYRRSDEEITLDTPLGEEERARLLRFLQLFAELSWDDGGLICSMLGGKTLERLARERGISPQAIHARWKKLTSAHPEFGALANGYIGAGYGRKPNKQKQLELFKNGRTKK